MGSIVAEVSSTGTFHRGKNLSCPRFAKSLQKQSPHSTTTSASSITRRYILHDILFYIPLNLFLNVIFGPRYAIIFPI
ncbi:hypothetical protein L873DRAFT_65150 [Choiromyces venosus 120613-1]|uniref:Uncharacterized protein n=1 Tax=Choiromyces venosus 120613-1 TaxID=1336337 RepID=A0A3N4J9S4_9PEZI|nr:hypothetical protein L873DRAFT_65150 [Choiromyces venosus 120613-1]